MKKISHGDAHFIHYGYVDIHIIRYTAIMCSTSKSARATFIRRKFETVKEILILHLRHVNVVTNIF